MLKTRTEQLATTDNKKPIAVWPRIGLGFGLLAIWLIIWHLLFDAAGWFALAMALPGTLGWLLSLSSLAKNKPLTRHALRTAGLGAMILAYAASLSLGAFLPAGVAQWISPVLGKFGAGIALWVLVVGLAVGLVLLRGSRYRVLIVDMLLLNLLAALYVPSQVSKQADFPGAPADTNSLATLFNLTFYPIVIGLVIMLAVWLLGNWFARREDSRVRGVSHSIFNWLWHWTSVVAVVALTASLAQGLILKAYPADGWLGFAGLGAVLLVLRLGNYATSGTKRLATKLLRSLGGVFLLSIGVVLTFFLTTEDLEAVLARNTAERYSMQFWRGAFGDERFASRAPGGLSGVVLEGGKPLAGAAVVLSTVSGQTYSATTGPEGRYSLPGVPAGNYLPMAINGPEQEHSSKFGNPVAAVREGQTTNGIDFTLNAARPVLSESEQPQTSLQIDAPTEITKDNPVVSTAQRRSFTFSNGAAFSSNPATGVLSSKGSKRLEGGIIHEPMPEAGNGPFPLLLIVYPGPANAWEGVSVQLAAQGYVVISYFPNRLLDLQGDLDDLRLLMKYTFDGKMSARGDARRVAVVGGSVSTTYTYLMAQQIVANEQQRPNLKALVNYGGLLDLYRFRNSWERGQVIIDEGISGLEYLLIAFGRPDTRPELYARFSPGFRLKAASLPPTLLVHVNKDIIVPVEQSQLADELFKRLNIPHELILYPDLEHYLDLSKRDPAYTDMLNRTTEFLGRNMK